MPTAYAVYAVLVLYALLLFLNSSRKLKASLSSGYLLSTMELTLLCNAIQQQRLEQYCVLPYLTSTDGLSAASDEDLWTFMLLVRASEVNL